MNPLPRLLGLALFVVLAVLVALLAAPAWRDALSDGVTTREASLETAPSAAGAAANRAARIAAQAPRIAAGLALAGLLLAAALVFSLAARSAHAGESHQPFVNARSEIGALEKLAVTSVAQGAELSRERDVRRRAEADVELKQHLLAQSLEERIRLGHDLHDGIIQSLYAAGLTLEAVRALVRSDPAEADHRLDQIRTSLNNTIREVRTHITGLTPDNLRRAGFAQALEAMLTELRAGRPTRFDVKVDGEATALLSPDQGLEALQIAREAVSNALRHGGASLLTLRVHKGDGEVCLLVQDDGHGFNVTHRRDGGHGLDNMQARARRLGATLRVLSQPGDGTRVIATLPILQSTAVE
ncbi:MAG: sensor histidine kinase [Opitutus sp.]|nr:sensor histidine kinase [Opitutus sp.]